MAGINEAVNRSNPQDVETFVARDYWVFAEDDTEYWVIPENLINKIDKVVTVYTYDASFRTYLCEVSPSYWCMGIYREVVLKAQYTYNSLSEDERDQIENYFENAPITDDYYRVPPGGVLGSADGYGPTHFGPVPLEDMNNHDDDNEANEYVIGHFHCNNPF